MGDCTNGTKGAIASLEANSVPLSIGSESLSDSDNRMAAIDIRHFLFLLLDEGLTIFYQHFTAKSIEPQLFGALTSAMSAFYADGSGPVGYRVPEGLEFRGHRFPAGYGVLVTGVLLHHGSVPEQLNEGLRDSCGCSSHSTGWC